MSDDDTHPILTAVGVVAVAIGLLIVIQPGLAASISTGYAAVTVVGLLAVVQAARVVRARQATELRAAETPDVETVESVPTPGDSFDRTVAELGSGPRRVRIRERSDLRDTLEAAAVTAVADRENCPREEARERIEAGTWTDDVYAASFLGGDDAPSVSLLDRIRLAASTESPFQHSLRRTADAIARKAGVAEREDDEREAKSDAGGDDEGGGGDETADHRTDGRGADDRRSDDRREVEA